MNRDINNKLGYYMADTFKQFKQLSEKVTTTKVMTGNQAKIISNFVIHINELLKFDTKFTSNLEPVYDDYTKYFILTQYLQSVRKEISKLTLENVENKKDILDAYDLLIQSLSGEHNDNCVLLIPIIVNLNIKYIDVLSPALELC
jgi:hypothetical protein